MYYKYWQKLYS